MAVTGFIMELITPCFRVKIIISDHFANFQSIIKGGGERGRTQVQILSVGFIWGKSKNHRQK